MWSVKLGEIFSYKITWTRPSGRRPPGKARTSWRHLIPAGLWTPPDPPWMKKLGRGKSGPPRLGYCPCCLIPKDGRLQKIIRQTNSAGDMLKHAAFLPPVTFGVTGPVHHRTHNSPGRLPVSNLVNAGRRKRSFWTSCSYQRLGQGAWRMRRVASKALHRLLIMSLF